MAQSKKKWVAFKSNTTVPGDVLGEDKDQKMQVGEPVRLPEAYADHVVQDGFAAFCDAPKKAAPKKSGGGSANEKADAEAAIKLKAAQDRLDELSGKLADAAGDEEACEALGLALKQAEAELAALQSAS